MAYSTTADVQIAAGGAESLKALSDYDHRDAIDAAVVESAIAEADAVINGFVHLRHDVPIAEVPPSIRYCSARMAVYFLRRRRNALTERDVAGYEGDIAWLEKVRSGKATVGVSPLPGKSSLVADRQTERPSDKRVSRDSLKGFY